MYHKLTNTQKGINNRPVIQINLKLTKSINQNNQNLYKIKVFVNKTIRKSKNQYKSVNQ